MPYYMDLSKRIKQNKSSHLVLFSAISHPLSPPLKLEGISNPNTSQQRQLEYNLLQHICSVFEDEPERASLLATSDKNSPFEMTQSLLEITEHPWFTEMAAKRGPESFISEDLGIVYHRWRKKECFPQSYSAAFMPGHVQINGEDYIQVQISMQLRKILQRLSLSKTEVTVNDKKQRVFNNHGQTQAVHLIGHGTLLTGCVFSDTPSIALTLGLPLKNVEISSEQFKGVQEMWENIPKGLTSPFRRNLEGIGNKLSVGIVTFKKFLEETPY